jgi:hypothetical protein
MNFVTTVRGKYEGYLQLIVRAKVAVFVPKNDLKLKRGNRSERTIFLDGTMYE